MLRKREEVAAPRIPGIQTVDSATSDLKPLHQSTRQRGPGLSAVEAPVSGPLSRDGTPTFLCGAGTWATSGSLSSRIRRLYSPVGLKGWEEKG